MISTTIGSLFFGLLYRSYCTDQLRWLIELNEDEFVVALIEKDGVSRNATCWHTVYLRRNVYECIYICK
ncbi:unnamed protein product [Acanthoscelides obtectus]|uniref:Uncharacterized protein n=1 Tax=Acanthoscelides obtectus TaxID=200917 RepID=A0A9P0MAN7_ACAOB|nr:unnamed protein product [Acanthoscelides obtectus]CAK1627257.1 hypothetical protein AOBTE_LOCUS4440 [Acanthoscelides obtectus]